MSDGAVRTLGEPAAHPGRDAEVAVWAVTTACVRHEWLEFLDSGERQRFAALLRSEDRTRFLLGCVLARAVSARVDGRRPGDVVLTRGCPDCGRPHGRVRVADSTVELSVSHSGDWVLVAASSGRAVGVDVEAVRSTVDVGSLADIALHPAERPVVMAAADPGLAFTRYWTRKEALLKATGLGLRASPSGVRVSGPDEPARLVDWAGYPARDPAWLTDLHLADGYVACVAAIAPRQPAVGCYAARDLLAGLG